MNLKVLVFRRVQEEPLKGVVIAHNNNACMHCSSVILCFSPEPGFIRTESQLDARTLKQEEATTTAQRTRMQVRRRSIIGYINYEAITIQSGFLSRNFDLGRMLL